MYGIRADKIVGYTYQADTWCPACIERLWGSGQHSAELVLDRAARDLEVDRYDEASFDSGDFPKVIFAGQVEDDEHCGSCHEELGEYELDDDRTYEQRQAELGEYELDDAYAPYCDYCEREGHTFRSCPQRDDSYEEES